jgi:hypothetical protein
MRERVLGLLASNSFGFGAERTVLAGIGGDCGVDGSSEVEGVDMGGCWGGWSATSTYLRETESRK